MVAYPKFPFGMLNNWISLACYDATIFAYKYIISVELVICYVIDNASRTVIWIWSFEFSSLPRGQWLSKMIVEVRRIRH